MKSCKKNITFTSIFLIFTIFNRQLVSFGTVREIWVFGVQKINNSFSFQARMEILEWGTPTLPMILPFQNLQPSFKIDRVIDFLNTAYFSRQNQFLYTKVLLSEYIISTSGHVLYFLRPSDPYINTDISFKY